MIVGRSTDAAPISRLGVVLSQPTRQTTPSIIWPRMVSSTAMAARFLNIIAVGRKALSLTENTGTMIGKPPAS